jgi:hypothetical protein
MATQEVPLSEIAVEGSSFIHVLDETGDSRFQWDKSDPLQVEKARARFAELKAKGMAAYRVTAKGEQELLHDFDESAERIVMRGPVVGG